MRFSNRLVLATMGTVWSIEKESSGFDSGDATNQQARLEGMHEQALLEERSGKRPRSPLVSNALNQALSSRHTAAGIVFHRDRGS